MTNRQNIGIIGLGILLTGLSGRLNAQIYNWQTREVIPGTEGITPGPQMRLQEWNSTGHTLDYADLSGNLDLHGSSFVGSWLNQSRWNGADLTGAYFNYASADQTLAPVPTILQGADFSGTNLTNANFCNAVLTNANLTGTTVQGANFSVTTSNGFTAAQLYSTASYVSGSLQGIRLQGNDLTGWNFAGKNLTSASFCQGWVGAFTSPTYYTKLADADFTNAQIGAADFSLTTQNGFTADQLYSTASYKEGDLAGLQLRGNDLSGWNFAGRNLTNASFKWQRVGILSGSPIYATTLDNADLTDAVVTGADFGATGLTASQLCSTANYKSGQLQGLGLEFNDLAGCDLADKNLAGARFAGSELTNANLSGADLSGASFFFYDNAQAAATLAGADLRRANLSRASLVYCDLTGAQVADANLDHADLTATTLRDADLTNATIRGANLDDTTALGFTSAQFYSTITYKSGDLRDIGLECNDLTGWNFAGKALPGARFGEAVLTNADLSAANLSGASFFGWWGAATLNGTNLSGATVVGADFGNTTSKGFTKEQLYSTASYQAGDLHGIGLRRNDLTGWNLTNQNLTDADFFNATLTNANLSRADTRGADTRGTTNLTDDRLVTAITTNTILPDGHIAGLSLAAGQTLPIRDYHGGIAITIDNGMALAEGSILDILFADTTWGSTITLASGSTPDLAGTLRLGLADGANPAGLVGTTFHLFDWNGQLALGDRFDAITAPPGWAWDAGNLYAAGDITLTAVPEPAMLVLAMIGAGLALCRRYRTVPAQTVRGRQ
ncbi:MAG TPA: pentapeptide repeat-containing protein [Phycisphaerae bacterium]|nr:pentapeptide repeat-containing protein [Phycisphaerae bacterium]HRY70765.1 pentapeptide repeat-containing protein [Phycisphaerae bacterium]HSA28881.1 pentapeptide repeat-containing protein [Phycisphaerae bacterium]